MASKNTSSNSRQAVQRSNSDSARWIAGLLPLFIGLFAAAAVFFFVFQLGRRPERAAKIGRGTGDARHRTGKSLRLGRSAVGDVAGRSFVRAFRHSDSRDDRAGRRADRPSAAAAVQPFDPFAVPDYDPGVADAGIRLRRPLEPLLLDGWGGAFGIAFGPLSRTHIGAFER